MSKLVWQLIVTLVIVAIVMKMIPWILLAAAVAGAAWTLRELCLADRDRRKLEDARRDGLIRRADQQHNWAMAGDPRGIYGQDYRDMKAPSIAEMQAATAPPWAET